MLKKIRQFFSSKGNPLINREFDSTLFIHQDLNTNLTRKGYVLVKNVLPSNIVDELLAQYQHITGFEDHQSTDYFINSVSFYSSEIRHFTYRSTYKILSEYLKNILNFSKLRIPISIGFCINPAYSKSGSRMHQDPSLIDETLGNSLVIWISLCDMDKNNGCLHVLPGSHLFGNSYRSNFHIKWLFEPYMDIINENAIPIPTKAGDIIIFDPALIHGSTANTTDKDRLAIQISAIPKNLELINVIEKNSFWRKYFLFYNIDESYFTEEHVSQIPSTKYPILYRRRMNIGMDRIKFANLINLGKRISLHLE